MSCKETVDASASSEQTDDRNASDSDDYNVIKEETKVSTTHEEIDASEPNQEEYKASASRYEPNLEERKASASSHPPNQEEYKASASRYEPNLEKSKASASQEYKASASSAALHLLSSLFQCRECVAMSSSVENSLDEPCCIGRAVAQAIGKHFPVDLLWIIESYALTSVSRCFLTHPAPRSAGVIQCYIVRSADQLNLFMEITEQEKYRLVREDINHLMHLSDQGDSLEKLSNFSDSMFNQRREPTNLKRNKSVERKLFHNAISYLRAGDDIFLLRANRVRYWVGNTYNISTTPHAYKPHSKYSNHNDYGVIGKVHANFGGSQYVMSERRSCAAVGSSTSICAAAKKRLNPWCDTGVIKYDHFYQVTGSPVRMKVFLPNRSFYQNHTQSCKTQILKQIRLEQPTQATSADNDDNTAQNLLSMRLSPTKSLPLLLSRDLNDTAESVFDFETPGQQIECYENLQPVFHDGMGAYVLHFDDHRVREKSVKNFKMVRLNDPEKRTLLQVGRAMDRNIFVMDYSYPLSALQAFQIAVSTIDPKFAI